MAYSATYSSADLDDIAIDLVGTILAVITQNATLLVTLIIVGYLIGVVTGVIRGAFNIFRGFGVGS